MIIKPKKIYKIPIKKIKYILIDKDKRRYFFDYNLDSEDLLEIAINENKVKELLENSFKKIPDSFIEIKPKNDDWILNMRIILCSIS
ncbi:hypothetical protein [Candidatus Nanopusillus massiliensis]|uniref:hypothetical protein n=1 Tax=Candidatus Nanopusillus massiliensis TaxID=2897163 RepID=UPI001E2CF4AB|nr:hypothetical protein [Candidatus Nanopusillus massiliensis]